MFEAGPKNFSAFAPDIPGCFALGDTVDITRQRFLEAANAHLNSMASDHEPIPDPITTAFDFKREEDDEIGQYVVEWLTIPLPESSARVLTAA